MLPYFLLLGIPLIVSWLPLGNGQQYKKRQKLILSVFFIGWLILLCLRDKTIGIDLDNYLPWFQSVAETPWNKLFVNTEAEWGYIFLLKLISCITTNNQVFLAIIAVITIGPIFYLYLKESDNAILSIAILITFLFSMYFSGLRQCIAMAFVVPAYYMVKRKKIVPFLLLILAASLFHNSAIVILLLYPIYHANITIKKLPIVVIILLVALLFNREIINLVLSLLGGRYEDKYYNTTTETGSYSILFLLIIFACYAFIVPTAEKTDREIIGLRNILILMVVIQSFALAHSLAMRMNYYFLLFVPLLMAKITNVGQEKDKNIILLSKIIMIVFFFFYFFYSAYTGANTLRIFPYIPFWR